MAETIIINQTDPVLAALIRGYLKRRYPDINFAVTRYYSDIHHVVTHAELDREQLQEMQAYANGVSDVLSKIIE